MRVKKGIPVLKRRHSQLAQKLFDYSIIYDLCNEQHLHSTLYLVCSFLWRYCQNQAQAASFWRFLCHTQLDTHTHTQSPERVIGRRRDRYLYKIKQTQDTNIHAVSGIRP